MTDPGAKPLAGWRILLSNDDGIAAPGLAVLRHIAEQLSDDVWICAPEIEQSGAGHSLTLRQPLRVRNVRGNQFAVDGTPTDCIMMAIHELMKGKRPDLVLSGVNRGSNMAEDITYSGTVAAAMEATLLGVPAIALSQHIDTGHSNVHWGTAEAVSPRLIAELCRAGWPMGVFININFPDVAASAVGPATIARQGQRSMGENIERRVDPRGQPYYWVGALRNDAATVAGTDLAVVESGGVAVTPVHLDFTHEPALAHLGTVLGDWAKAESKADSKGG